MTYLELKKRALALIFSAICLIKSGNYIKEHTMSGAVVCDVCSIKSDEVIKSISNSSVIVCDLLPLQIDTVIREVGINNSSVAARIMPITTTKLTREMSRAEVVSLITKSIASNEFAFDISIVAISSVYGRFMESKNISRQIGYASATTSNSKSIISNEHNKSEGCAGLKTAKSAYIGNSHLLSREIGYTVAQATKTMPMFFETAICCASIAAVGLVKHAIVADYAETVIRNISGKKIEDIYLKNI